MKENLAKKTFGKKRGPTKNEEKKERKIPAVYLQSEKIPKTFLTSLLEEFDEENIDKLSIAKVDESISLKLANSYMDGCILENIEMLATNDTSVQVSAVEHNMKMNKMKKEKVLQKERLQEISWRVETILDHCGFDLDEVCTTSDNVDITIEKEKHKERQNLTSMFSKSEKLSNSRNNIMHELNYWFRSLDEDLENLLANVNDDYTHAKFQQVYRNISDTIKSIEKMKNLIKRAIRMDNEGKQESFQELDLPRQESSPSYYSDSSASVKEENLVFLRQFYNEKELENHNTFQMVTNNIFKAIEHASKITSSSQNRSGYQLCAKQFAVVSNLVETIQRKCEDLSKRLQKTKDDSAGKLKALQTELNERENSMNALQLENNALKDQLTEAKKKYEKKLKQKNKSVTLPSEHSSGVEAPPEILLDNKKHDIEQSEEGPLKSKASSMRSLGYGNPTKSEDNMGDENNTKLPAKVSGDRDESEDDTRRMMEELKRVHVRLAYAEKLLVEREAELRRLRQQLGSSDEPSNAACLEQVKALNSQLRWFTEELKKKDNELRLSEKTIAELQRKLTALINQKTLEMQLQNKSVLDTSGLTGQQLVAKLRTEFEKELQRLRAFIIKEQHRFQANLRKVHAEHEKQINAVKTENVQIIRSLYRFKRVIDDMSQDSNSDVAAEYYGDEGSGGAKISGLQATVIDVLMRVEKNITTMLLKRKLAVKEIEASKQNVAKDLEHERARLQNISESYCDQRKLTSQVEVQNTMITKEYRTLLQVNQALRSELIPCKELLAKCSALQVEVKQADQKTQESCRNAKETIKDLECEKTRLKSELKQEKLTNMRESLASWRKRSACDKRHLVEKAYYDKRLSCANHEKVHQLIDRTETLSNQQLVDMSKHYRKLKLYEQVRKTLEKYSDEICVENKLPQCFTQINEVIEKTKSAFQKRKQQFDEKRVCVYEEMDRLLSQQDNELSITSYRMPCKTPPVSRQGKRTESAKSRISPLPPVNSKVHQQQQEEINEVVSFNIETGLAEQPFWKLPSVVPNSLLKIHTPKLLEMDLKRSKFNILKGVKDRLLPPIATLFPE